MFNPVVHKVINHRSLKGEFCLCRLQLKSNRHEASSEVNLQKCPVQKFSLMRYMCFPSVSICVYERTLLCITYGPGYGLIPAKKNVAESIQIKVYESALC
jgi:hypothetical protein